MQAPNIEQSLKIKLVISRLHLEGTGINGKSSLKFSTQGTTSEGHLQCTVRLKYACHL